MKNQRHIAIAADVWASSEVGGCPDAYTRMGDHVAADLPIDFKVSSVVPVGSNNVEFMCTVGGVIMLFAAVSFVAILFF